MVQTIKNVLKKAEDAYKALFAYRNSPFGIVGLSPAQLFIERRLRSTSTSAPLLKFSGSTHTRELLLQRQMNQYKYHSGKTELQSLNTGTTVMMQHSDNQSYSNRKSWYSSITFISLEDGGYQLQ
ncbi:hypothetical protein SNE40_018468 [Patella caerulea]|uniref:Uncharacterized protein n=1 Tax=Patella caerulea TaxID=87958 RepID=A0AAN8J745_PATCE